MKRSDSARRQETKDSTKRLACELERARTPAHCYAIDSVSSRISRTRTTRETTTDIVINNCNNNNVLSEQLTITPAHTKDVSRRHTDIREELAVACVCCCCCLCHTNNSTHTLNLHCVIAALCHHHGVVVRNAAERSRSIGSRYNYVVRCLDIHELHGRFHNYCLL